MRWDLARKKPLGLSPLLKLYDRISADTPDDFPRRAF
jgi:hypothetical protein